MMGTGANRRQSRPCVAGEGRRGMAGAFVDLMAPNRVTPGRGNLRRHAAPSSCSNPKSTCTPGAKHSSPACSSKRSRNGATDSLIETHSDHIVDRVCISVRQGKLKPDDVAILYFEPNGNAVSIHNISVDAAGNLCGAPPGYREFFLRETDRLLGFAD